MNIQTIRSINGPAALRSVAFILTALGISMAATAAIGQQVIPFGDVPATSDFAEAEIAARGHQKLPNLAYSAWRKLCFRDVHGAETKMVCHTSIEGKSDLGELILKVDLMEREDAPAARLQIFVPPGNLLEPGIRLTVDKYPSVLVPYTICLANGCVAAAVPKPKLLHELEGGAALSLELVNSNVVRVVASLPLDSFARAHQGTAAQILDQKLEASWERSAGRK